MFLQQQKVCLENNFTFCDIYLIVTFFRFQCDERYTLKGFEVSRCVRDVQSSTSASWDRPAPSCERK